MEQEKILLNHPGLSCNFNKLEISPDSDYRGKHFHSALEIVFVDHGSIMVHLEKDQVRVLEGSFLIIGSNVPHTLTYDRAPAGFSYSQIDISKLLEHLYPNLSMIPSNLEKSLPFCRTVSKKDPLFALCSALFEELEEQQPHFEIVVTGMLMQLTAQLQRVGLLKVSTEITKDPLYPKILPALSYAEEHYTEKIRLEEMCAALCMDKYYFCKLFKKLFGITFFEYLNDLRLKNAEAMLSFTDKTVTEIALECGFSTVQYFNLVFAKAKGCSPSKFRSAVRGGLA